jgi:EmrB/QacA subfamily drug resistance transporter
VANDRRVLVVFIGLMLGNAMAALDSTLVATALPTIVSDLGGLRDVSWVATAYLLTGMASGPLYGKFGDLYGRKHLFLFAIVTFLVASALCGTAQSMPQLIAFRALQGLGAGGLIALPMAMLADLVPARDLGKWIGYSGFVFALSSVAGPLFGGLFSQHLSWRWAFLVNIPIGIISLVIVGGKLHLPPKRTEHRIDYLGAALMVTGVTCIVFLTSWGGSREDWDSPVIIGLGLVAAASLVALVIWERHASEPILPPRLFRISIARVSLALNAATGLLFFAGLYFLSAFLQLVDGIDPTESGLYLIPLMGSTVIGTMIVGRLIDRSRKYRRYPIVGTIIVLVALGLLVGLDVASSPAQVVLAAAVLGFGLGLVMQVLILAIQNAVELRDIGVATSMSMFSRQLGGALGLALLGSVFNSRLTHWIGALVPESANVDPATIRGRPETLAGLTPAVREAMVEAFARSFHTVFLVCVPVGVIALVLALRLREIPLREHASADELAGKHVLVETAGDDLAIALEGAVLTAAAPDAGAEERAAVEDNRSGAQPA